MNNQHFDHIVMNPPYNRNLHLDFFNKAVTMADEVICIHPSAPFFNRRPVREQKRVIKFKENIRDNMTSMHLLDGNLYFSAGLFVPLSITHTSTCAVHQDGMVQVTGLIEDTMRWDKLNYFGSWVEYMYDNVPEKNLLNSQNAQGNYFVNIGLIRGHVPVAGQMFNADMFTMVPKEYKVEYEPNLKWHHYGFDTEQQANNFLNYLKSDYARIWLALYKNNQHLDSGTLASVPYPDVEQPFCEATAFEEMGWSYNTAVDMGVLPYYNNETYGSYSSGVHTQDVNRTYSVRDNERAKETHEVFTPQVIVDMMLDMVTDWGCFLDPACGDGNILVRIAERRLEMGHDPEEIAHNLYGFDIVESNVIACRNRLTKLLGFGTVFEEQILCKNYLGD